MPFDAKSPEMLHIMNHSGAKGKDAKTPGKDAKRGGKRHLAQKKQGHLVFFLATKCF